MLYQVPFYGNMARDFSKAGIVDPHLTQSGRHTDRLKGIYCHIDRFVCYFKIGQRTVDPEHVHAVRHKLLDTSRQ